LCKYGPFVWTDETEEAFQDLNPYLTSPPVMVDLKLGEPLVLYIAARDEAMSMVMVSERSEPPRPQETKEASAKGSGSQDPEPVRSREVGVAAGS
jgi:dsDNA-binding SOS-regulon protein